MTPTMRPAVNSEYFVHSLAKSDEPLWMIKLNSLAAVAV